MCSRTVLVIGVLGCRCVLRQVRSQAALVSQSMGLCRNVIRLCVHSTITELSERTRRIWGGAPEGGSGAGLHSLEICILRHITAYRALVSTEQHRNDTACMFFACSMRGLCRIGRLCSNALSTAVSCPWPRMQPPRASDPAMWFTGKTRFGRCSLLFRRR